MRWLSVSFLVIVLDQITKYIAESQLDLYQSIPVTSFFNITLAYNTGAAFSMFAHHSGWQRWVLSAVAIAASVMLFTWLRQLKAEERWQSCAIVLVLGGAIGNLIDRLLYGHVIDFLDFYWRTYHYPAFNVADSAITVGAIMLGLTLFGYKAKS
jgi:signal peptidase II